MTWVCMCCSCIIDATKEDDLAVCQTCQETNNDVFDFREKPEQFKKELDNLFYADTFEHWYVSVKELDFFMKRWNILKKDTQITNPDEYMEKLEQ